MTEETSLIGNIIAIVGVIVVIVVIVTLIIVTFKYERCPYCAGKLINNDYDESINKDVWTCERCGAKWVLY